MPNTTFHKKNYIEYRWTPEQRRFERQAKLNRHLHVLTIALATVAVVAALFVGGLATIWRNGLFALAGAAGVLNVLYDFRQHFRRSAGVSAALRRERELFEAGVGVYVDKEQAFSRFVRRCESIIQSTGDGYMPLLLDTADILGPSRPSSLPESAFPRSSAAASLRDRLGRLGSSQDDDDDLEFDDDLDDDDDNSKSGSSFRSRFGSSSSSSSSSGRRSPFSSSSSSSPFSRRSTSNSPFGSGSRFAGGRPVGSSGGMRREENDDPALAGIGLSNSQTGVRVAAYYPKEVGQNQWQSIKAYVFLGHALDAVVADAEDAEPDKVAKVLYDRNTTTRYRIPEGAQVTVTPHMKGFQFNPQSVSIGFYRAWHRLDFEMRATDARLDEATNGYLTFSVEGLVVADVPLSVYVQRRQNKEEKNVLRRVIRKPYRAVYASFADEDTHLAERLRPIYDAIGMYNMRDRMQHRSEQGWSEDMLQALDEAEVFQLFWSRAAAGSETVQRELQRALERNPDVENFVRVVYWEQPPATLPDSLSDAHKNYLPDIAESED